MLKSRNVNIAFIVLLIIALVADYRMNVPWWVYTMIILSYVAIHVYGTTVLDAEYFIPVKFKGDPASNAVALTFDDGPVAGKTEKILDILKEYNVKAVFFCIGHRVKEHPGIVKRIQQEGHLIANHSYWHGKLFDLQTSRSMVKELEETDHVIEEYTGLKPRFFRPPYGVTNPMLASAIRSTGHSTIGWSLRSFDTISKNSPALLKRITSSLKKGDIVLLHDYSENMIAILPSLLDHIKKLGLKIVRVDELLNERAYV